MKKFKHLSLDERIILRELIRSPYMKKKNGKVNLSKIAREMGRSKNTICYELKYYNQIKRYHPVQAQKRYLEKRLKCRKHASLTFQQIEGLNIKFNHLHYIPEIICKLYEIEFNQKFPMCFKTLYKYIYLGLFNLSKKNLYFHGKHKKIKKAIDNRGKLSNFKTIEQAKHDKNIFGGFQMDTIVGKDHQSSCLVLTEELTKFTICKKLKEKSASEVIKSLKEIFKSRLLKNVVKGIITDQGKEFADGKKIEKVTNANLYFCDPATPTQKPIVERINRDIRHGLPKGTDLNKVSKNKINGITDNINNRIRRCLDGKTSYEVFLDNLK